jgi:hypothetical protein
MPYVSLAMQAMAYAFTGPVTAAATRHAFWCKLPPQPLLVFAAVQAGAWDVL